MNKKTVLNNIAYAIFVITCVLTAIDTGLFVYPSLSRYLLLEAGAMVLSVLCILTNIVYRRDIAIGKLGLFIFAWILYIILHGCLIAETCEQYRTYYLCTTLLLILVAADMQKARLLTRKNIETTLLAIAAIHIVCIAAQSIGVAESGNEYFDVTGCNENPTVTAIYLVGCIPMLAARIKRGEHKPAYFIFLLAVMTGIVILNCRTAYIGLGVEFAVVIAVKYSRQGHALIKRHGAYTCLLGVVLLPIVVVAGMKMYGMKKDSADGRMLIWKLSTEMMAGKPSGYGYGLFEKNYNLRQADYFANREYTDTEKRNSDFVYMPYNDYLEHGIEGGIVGMVFLLAFYAMMAGKAVQADDKEAVAVFAAFAVMSLFNFVYTTIQSWLLVVCYASFVLAKTDCHVSSTIRLSHHAGIAILVPVAFAMYTVFGFAGAQMQLKRTGSAAIGLHCTDDRNLEAMEHRIGTSEAYWSHRAANSIACKNYTEALSHIRKARRYSSHPELFAMEYSCLKHTGNVDDAACRLDTLSYMLPQKLSVKYMLMKHHIGGNRPQEALRYADDILSTEIKVKSDEAENIRNRAKHFKKHYEQKN